MMQMRKASAHYAYRCSQELRFRKGNGTRACIEKAKSWIIAMKADGQGKTSMVNAKLREA
jgi:hypothetical protein